MDYTPGMKKPSSSTADYEPGMTGKTTLTDEQIRASQRAMSEQTVDGARKTMQGDGTVENQPRPSKKKRL